MPLVSSVLESGLANLTPTSVEATAAQALANAWGTYFQGASVSGVPAADISAAKSAFQAALTGMSAPGAAAAAIQSAVTAFWGVIVPAAATIWVVPGFIIPSATPPPGMSGIAAALSALFSANAANPSATLAQAANQIATALHGAGGLGGIAILQPTAPGPPVPTPIL